MSEPDRPPHPQQPPPYPGRYPPPPPAPYAGFTPPPPLNAPKNGLGTAALVIAIIALFSVFGGVVLGVVAIILGVIGLQRVNRGEATNRGVAVAGIVLGILSIIEAIVAIALSIWWFNSIGGTDYVDCVSRADSDQEALQQCADRFRERVEDQFSITLTTPAPATP
jgi:hypothetical protein